MPPKDCADPGSSQAVLDRAADLAQSGRSIRLGDVIESFGARGYGPVIALLAGATVALTPMPATTPPLGIAMALVGAQYATSAGRPVRTPRCLRRLEVDGAKATSIIDYLRPSARALDGFVARRAEWLMRGRLTLVWGALVVILALSLVPLSLTPGGTIPPALLLAAVGVAITARDGWLLGAAGTVTALFLMVAVRLLL
ncbi:MAG: hypothetical protein EA355_03000 [Rhodobacteraceae bacterium]|nr:MAG: hypothetical protein EA355_03000 [Paracoccaceae bacterium]